MSESVTSKQEKIAVRRRTLEYGGRVLMGYCTMNCPCDRELPAYDGDQTCPSCGSRWSETGWRLK